MPKIFIFCFLLFFLSACGDLSNCYDEGYDDGYDGAYSKTKLTCQDSYDEGYDEGDFDADCDYYKEENEWGKYKAMGCVL